MLSRMEIYLVGKVPPTALKFELLLLQETKIAKVATMAHKIFNLFIGFITTFIWGVKLLKIVQTGSYNCLNGYIQ